MLTRTVAALFVEHGGVYFGVDGVDPWDESRDARLYSGPHPVVAHPPCARWGRYWHGGPNARQRRTKGDDDGCFRAAIRAVRRWGGVIEHPEASSAWQAFGIIAPPRDGGWVSSGGACELDLHARHSWLIARKEELVEALRADPDYCDPKIAGWWMWGISQYIGNSAEWCSKTYSTRPSCNAEGVLALRVRENLRDRFRALSRRLLHTSILCGDYRRVLTPSIFGSRRESGLLTAVLLDPPYDGFGKKIYACTDVASDVRDWAIEHGEDSSLRIALCGYTDTLDMPSSWNRFCWSSKGGTKNRAKEVIYFSPRCLTVRQGELFGEVV